MKHTELRPAATARAARTRAQQCGAGGTGRSGQGWENPGRPRPSHIDGAVIAADVVDGAAAARSAPTGESSRWTMNGEWGELILPLLPPPPPLPRSLPPLLPPPRARARSPAGVS